MTREQDKAYIDLLDAALARAKFEIGQYKKYGIHEEKYPLKDADDLVKLAGLIEYEFACELNYSQGVGKGFLTKKPSKNAQKVIDCVKGKS